MPSIRAPQKTRQALPHLLPYLPTHGSHPLHPLQNMDLKQKEKADSWQNFISGKGSKKKTGFFTGGCVWGVREGREEGGRFGCMVGA